MCSTAIFFQVVDIQQFANCSLFWVVFAFGILLEKLQRPLDVEFVHELCFPCLFLLIQQATD
jgi:hypothetical protein